MCGRFFLIEPGVAQKVLRYEDGDTPPRLRVPRQNICPGQLVLAIRAGGGGNVAEAMHWGIQVPGVKSGKPTINARAERLRESRFWNSIQAGGRCAIPADGFYEWPKAGNRRLPVRFGLNSSEPFAFAAISRRVGGTTQVDKDGDRSPATASGDESDPISYECVIVTTNANDLVGSIHDRMPVILDREGVQRWLSPKDGDIPTDLIEPFNSTLMTAAQLDAPLAADSSFAAGTDASASPAAGQNTALF